MKLKTKFQDEDFELGEVTDVDIATMPDGRIKAQAEAERGGLHTFFYKTKAEFDADWEDAPEEPKEYWFIDEEGDISSFDYAGDDYDKKMQAIGNFFETEEKAKKAVEKLKAWQRLKDKGVKLEIVKIGHRKYLEPTAEDDKTFDEVRELIKDFELIFGGGE